MFVFFDIKNGILEPEFSNNIYSYYVSVADDVTSLDLDFEMDPKTRINVIGNHDLKYGDNYVFIELEKNNIVNTYKFLVNKEETQTVFSYDEPVMLEIEDKKKETINYSPLVITVCILMIILIYKIIFHKNKKQLNR
jgi:hypothetical protein